MSKSKVERRKAQVLDETALILSSDRSSEGVKAIAAAGVAIMMAKKDLAMMLTHVDDHAETLRMLKTAMEAVMNAGERLDLVYRRFLRTEVENIRRFHAEKHTSDPDPTCMLCEEETGA